MGFSLFLFIHTIHRHSTAFQYLQITKNRSNLASVLLGFILRGRCSLFDHTEKRFFIDNGNTKRASLG